MKARSVLLKKGPVAAVDGAMRSRRRRGPGWGGADLVRVAVTATQDFARPKGDRAWTGVVWYRNPSN